MYEPKRLWGPVHLAMAALHSLGWTWTAQRQVVRQGHVTDILRVNPASWAHQVREAARALRWTTANARRMDMRGLTESIETETTNAALKAT